MRALKTLALAVCTSLALAPAARAEVQLSIRNGRVSITAKDATVRQILVEWARVGKIRIVNVERVPGGPLTLELKDVSEAEALDVLLRNLSGYMAAPRLALAADASVYDSIVVMPTTAAPASAAPARAPGAPNAPAPFSAPTFNQNDEDDSNGPARPGGPQRPPIFQTFPQPQPGGVNNNNVARPVLPAVRPGANNTPSDAGQAQQPVFVPPPPAPPGPQPTGSGAVSAPGMIAPAPGSSQPGQLIQSQRPNGE